MFKKIALGVVVVLGLLAAFVATRPTEFAVTRSATISAPPEIVFGYVNDLHKWGEWSPWEARDPAMKKEFSGAAAGVGASYAWSGNDDVGEGRMTIVESKANEQVEIKLEFMKPFEDTNSTTFTFEPAEGGTKATWTMAGTHGFLEKAFCMFFDMDAMIGADFEQGFAAMKPKAEEAARVAAAAKAKAEEEARAAAAAAAAAAAEATAEAPTP